MDEKLIQFIQKHRLIKRGKTVIVGVSGGPDSIALLHFLYRMKELWQLKLMAITINHQLRGEEAENDVKFVSEICNKWGIPLVVKEINVTGYKQAHHISTQVAARTLRYNAFREVMEQYEADYLALGHHGDDQIETMTMSLIRTTNLSGLTGIPLQRAFATGQIVRPLLVVTKEEIEAYLQRFNIKPRIDASNEETTYTRNFIRKWVVPKLKEKNANLHTTVQQLSKTLQEDESYLQEEAKKHFVKIVNLDEKNKRATIHIPSFIQCRVALQRRLYRLTLDYLYDEIPKELTYVSEEMFLSLLEDTKSNKIFHFPNRLIVEKNYDQIELYFMDPLSMNRRDIHYTIQLDELPATIHLFHDATLTISIIDRITEHHNPNQYYCSLDQISFPLHIRTRKPGDRMRYKGLGGTKKVKDIFIDDKIPRKMRDEIFLVTDDLDEVLWLIGVRKGELQKRAKNGPYLMLQYKAKLEGEINA